MRTVSLAEQLRGLDREELAFWVGIFFLDNRRLRALVSRMAPRLLDQPTCKPLTLAELDEISYTVKCFAEDVGAEELARELGKLRIPTKRRKKRAA